MRAWPRNLLTSGRIPRAPGWLGMKTPGHTFSSATGRATSIALVDAPEKQALRLCHAQRQGGWVNRPYLAFPKTDRHLHEQFLLQPEWQPARCRFEHVDPTPRQNAEQGFGLHVTGRERIREEPDEIDIQTCAIS